MARKSTYHSGMAGVYHVAAQLAEREFSVGITVGNTPHVDLLVGTPDVKRTFSVQVKTNRKGGTQSFWLLSAKAKDTASKDFYYIFVNLRGHATRPDFYVVSSQVVAKDLVVGSGKSTGWFCFPRNEIYREKWETLNAQTSTAVECPGS